MIRQPIISLFIRMIPEAFLVIYAICLLTGSKSEFKKILISGILGGAGVYVVRLLPIHFGIHTIISIMLYIALAVKLNEVEMHKAIAGALVSTIIFSVSDLILIAFYTNIIQISEATVTGQTWISVVSGTPSLFIFYILVRIIVYIKKKRINYEQR